MNTREPAWRNLLRVSGVVLIALVSGCAGPAKSDASAPTLAPAGTASAAEADALFHAFLHDFRAEALNAGVSGDTYDRAVANISLNARVLGLNLQQPEYVTPVWDYLAGAVSDWRVSKGQEMLAANAELFERLEKTYGVPRETLAAIWGLETGYGQSQGSFNLFEALATLGYDGPRKDYARGQFIAALKIAELEHLDPKAMTGSWAGAIGHTQFVPATYLQYAVDGDGDGKRDLWNSIADALASTANYLKANGWQTGAGWGEEVLLPTNFAYEEADPEIRKSRDDWVKLGLRGETGEALAGGAEMAAVLLPAGARGPAFLVLDNFNALRKYNFSTSYALAVGLLSDRLRGGAPIIGAWPRDLQPLTRDQSIALQTGLTALGYDSGGTDGLLGKMSRVAIRDFQKAHKLTPDGFATLDLLDRVTQELAAKKP